MSGGRSSFTLRERLAVDQFNDAREPASIAAAFGVSRWAIYKNGSNGAQKSPDAVRRYLPTGRSKLTPDGRIDGRLPFQLAAFEI